MKTEELDAQEMFHKISEQLEKLNCEFTSFNEKAIGNINSEKADEFRMKLAKLEEEAEKYFKKFCYSR